MTNAGSIRRWASRLARRRISWTDQRTIGGTAGLECFLGVVRWCSPGAGSPPAGRRPASPARRGGASVPAAGLVVVEPELGLGGLERVLDRPAPTLDADQHLERGAGRAPGGGVGQAGIAEAAPDEQATRPGAGLGAAGLLGFEIRQLQVAPVVEPRPLGAVTRRETYPGRCRKASGDLFRRAGHRRLAPGPERERAGDPEHVALARLAQGRLDLAHAVDAVGGDPSE